MKSRRQRASKLGKLFCYKALLLDSLVGVWPKPMLWPFYGEKITLPFGVLLSAGALNLSNFYLWQNLLIEMGILLPVIGLIYVFKDRKSLQWKKVLSISLILVGLWVPFLMWGFDLPRG